MTTVHVRICVIGLDSSADANSAFSLADREASDPLASRNLVKRFGMFTRYFHVYLEIYDAKNKDNSK